MEWAAWKTKKLLFHIFSEVRHFFVQNFETLNQVLLELNMISHPPFSLLYEAVYKIIQSKGQIMKLRLWNIYIKSMFYFQWTFRISIRTELRMLNIFQNLECSALQLIIFDHKYLQWFKKRRLCKYNFIWASIEKDLVPPDY